MMELVIGGSGSGKSAYAEASVCREHRRLAEASGNRAPLYYIADMIPYGAETEKKIAHHREMRAGKGFQTLEWYYGLAEHITAPDAPPLEGASVLLECISNLTANEMYEPKAAKIAAAEAVIRGVRMLHERCRNLVVVTNDVFRESGSDSEEMVLYKKNLARINRALAEEADRVTEVVSGIPIQIREKGKSLETNKSEYSAGVTLILGGAYQGKRAYAEMIFPGLTWADGKEIPFREIENAAAIDRFHLLVKRWMLAGKSAEDLTEKILGMNRKIIILCDEIGCGLVPVDAFEREYREAAGRVCVELAEHARRVDRVVCGIGMRMK